MKQFKEDLVSESSSKFDDSVMCYEGGSRKERSERSGGDKKISDTKYKNGNDEKFTKSTLQAGEKVKNLFNNENVLGHTHLQKVGDEMQKHGSKEKTGFMEKEADFVKELKAVQNFHLDTCISLLKVSIGLLVLQFIFACFCIIYFGCGIGNCENNLICCIHFIKFVQTLVLINTYSGNIKERQPNHPIGTLNSFLVFLLYYCCLYSFIAELVEQPALVHFCVVYPLTDGGMILISFIMISKVKAKSRDLIENKRFKEYNQEAEIALADILYLPQEFESDDGEEDF